MANLNKDDKLKALDAAIAQIEKEYGKGSVMRLGDPSNKMDVETTPTGSLSLDIALGLGGIPRGRVVEVFGPPIMRTIGQIMDTMFALLKNVADVAKGIIEALTGIVKFAAGVFTGDWERAWEGVKKIFKGVFDSLVGIVKVPLNLIIGNINLLLNGKTEADWNQILDGSLFYGHPEYLIIYIGLVLLTKVFATSATNGGGGCGGTFAPSLFIGCFTGFFFSRLWNMHQIGVYVPEKNFALLGMAGVMSGVMHAPLTGIFLIAEITSGYNLFMPLMIVAVSSYLTINIFEPHSIYGMRLAKQGRLVTHHTDHAVLTLMSLDSVVDRDFQAVAPDMELGQIVNQISRSRHRVLPVTDPAGALLGEINVVKIRHVVFRTELYHHFKASQLMVEPAATLSDSTPMTKVMRVFEETQAEWLPVIDTNNHLKGYISRRRMYEMYRKMVHDFSQD